MINDPASTPATVRDYRRLTDVIDDVIHGRVGIGMKIRSGDS